MSTPSLRKWLSRRRAGAARGRGALDFSVLATDGHTTVRLLDEAQLAAARELHRTLELPPDQPFFASPAHRWGPAAREIDLRLREICGPTLAALLPGHRPILSGFTSKGVHDEGVVKFHQDWTYTDERIHRAVFLWCPLVDCDRSNGGLEVVPASHRWSDSIRPSRRVHPTERLAEELADVARPVALRAGEALAFDPGLLHGSGPNRSGRERPAFTIGLVPVGAELIHFHERDDGVLEGWSVDEEFFTTHPYGTRPSWPPSVEPWTTAISEDDLRDGMARALSST